MRRSSVLIKTRYIIQTALAGTLSLLVSGCSMDVTRFKENPFGDPFTTGSLKSEPSRGAGRPSRQNWNPPPRESYPQASAPTQPVVTVGQGVWTSIGGTRITVGEGDTLTSISHRYGVPEKAIRSTNNLSASTQLSPGDNITIPIFDISGNNNRATSVENSTVAYNNTMTQQNSPVYKKTEQPSKEYNVSLPPSRPTMKTDGYKSSKTIVASNPNDKNTKHNEDVSAVKPAKPPVQVSSNTLKENPKVTASKTSHASSSADLSAFRWPARGRVIAGFGTAGNEGINIALPEGAAVRAVETGVVTYVGDELKNFGQLVVIRHENGFVSAYAHNSSLNVKRGDRVSRGQVIAKSGRSGNVTSPQLHFSLRKKGVPVDPISYLSGA